MTSARTLSWDWFPGTIPENVFIDDTAYIETTFSFQFFRSRRDTRRRRSRHHRGQFDVDRHPKQSPF